MLVAAQGSAGFVSGFIQLRCGRRPTAPRGQRFPLLEAGGLAFIDHDGTNWNVYVNTGVIARSSNLTSWTYGGVNNSAEPEVLVVDSYGW
jgi:hypothetical protein